MKIAVSGKGGTGKTTLCSLLCRVLEARGREVIAVDADSNANLAYALRVPNPEEVTPLAQMEELIKDRTGAQRGRYGAYFKMNPEVSDIPDKFKIQSGGVKLLVMGSVQRAGAGCACPEYVLMKALISHLLLNRDQDMVIDMEAGLEHLGRGVTEKVDVLLIVAQPNRVSCVTAARIHELATQLHIRNIFGVGNMISDKQDEQFFKEQITGFEFISFLSACDAVRECERDGRSLFSIPELRQSAEMLIDRFEEIQNG